MTNWYELLKKAMAESSRQYLDQFDDKMCTMTDRELITAGLHVDFICWGRQGWIYVPVVVDGKPVVRRISKHPDPEVRKQWLLKRAKEVISMLAAKGVKAEIIGSLVNGTAFRHHVLTYRTSSDAD